MFKLNWKRKWSFDRDAVCGSVFILPGLVVSIYIAEGTSSNTVFWVCCGVCVACLIGAKHWWAPVGATALYAIGPLLGVAIVQRRREAALGAAVCAGIIGIVWWLAESPNRRARQEFVDARYCPACNRPLRARVLHHPIMDGGKDSERHWFYRCACGECTLFDFEGNATRVLPQPPPSSGPAA